MYGCGLRERLPTHTHTLATLPELAVATEARNYAATDRSRPRAQRSEQTPRRKEAAAGRAGQTSELATVITSGFLPSWHTVRSSCLSHTHTHAFLSLIGRKYTPSITNKGHSLACVCFFPFQDTLAHGRKELRISQNRAQLLRHVTPTHHTHTHTEKRILLARGAMNFFFFWFLV